MYKIVGKQKGGSWEELDTASDQETAKGLLEKYRQAYGDDWTIKIKKG